MQITNSPPANLPTDGFERWPKTAEILTSHMTFRSSMDCRHSPWAKGPIE